jgi:5-methylcytosine-specific restriction endonuclease McrA
LCPRYWQSLESLGRKKDGGITQISPERSALLQQKWKLFDAVIAEEEPVSDDKSVDHFCPEVSYEIYGLFASFLHEYIDGVDRETLYNYHERRGTLDQYDVRWQWITGCHYTQCREYSIHAPTAKGKPSKTQRPGEVSPKRRWEVLERDKRTCVYCGRKAPEVILHVDHKVSVRDGGTDDMENLVTACSECNGGKGASSLTA